MMAPVPFCDQYNIVVIRKKVINKFPYTNQHIAGHTMYINMLPIFEPQGITSQPVFIATSFWLTRPQERPQERPQLIDLHNYTSASVSAVVNEFTS
jgi:hypothetical protein